MRRGKREEIIECPVVDPEEEVFVINAPEGIPVELPAPFEPAVPEPYEPAVPEPKKGFSYQEIDDYTAIIGKIKK